jgi:hypothetical protein
VWIIREFTGEPQGLDGQALRWCLIGDLKDANLLPADKPIVAALALPEVLIEAATDDYVINTFGSFAKESNLGRLVGVLCSTVAEAHAAARAGADFLAMGIALPTADLSALCASINAPIFASSIELETAWALGASGLLRI